MSSRLVVKGDTEFDQDISEAEGSQAVELIERIERGDRDAESELVRRFSRPVRFLLQHRTRNPDLAADLHQEALQIILTKAREGEIREPARLPSFVRGVAVNVLMSYHRQERRHPRVSDDEYIARAATDARGPVQSLEVEDKIAFVRQVLSELNTERDRRILSRYFLDQETKEAVCSELNISSEHFDRVLYRAKQRFKQIALLRSRGSH